MKSYIGDIEGKDLEIAVENARKVKGDEIHRLYLKVEDDNLVFVVRKKHNDHIDDIEVHRISSIPVEDQCDYYGGLINGYPICISVDELLKNCEKYKTRGFSKLTGSKNLSPINLLLGHCVTCRI